MPSEPPGGGDRGGTFTYIQLWQQGLQAATALTRMGVRAGDRVAVALPMSLESVVVTLACVRMDVMRVTLPLGGQTTRDLRDRVLRCGAGVVITADGCLLDGELVPLKARLDRAMTNCPQVRNVLVVRHLGRPVAWTPGRDRWWQEALEETRGS